MKLWSSHCINVIMLTAIHRCKCRLWAHSQDHWTNEGWKRIASTSKSRFYLHHVDGRVYVQCLPMKTFLPGCTVGRMQDKCESVMVLTIFSWNEVSPIVIAQVNFNDSTWFKHPGWQILSLHVHRLFKQKFLSHNRIIVPVAKLLLFWNVNKFSLLSWVPNSANIDAVGHLILY